MNERTCSCRLWIDVRAFVDAQHSWSCHLLLEAPIPFCVGIVHGEKPAPLVSAYRVPSLHCRHRGRGLIKLTLRSGRIGETVSGGHCYQEARRIVALKRASRTAVVQGEDIAFQCPPGPMRLLQEQLLSANCFRRLRQASVSCTSFHCRMSACQTAGKKLHGAPVHAFKLVAFLVSTVWRSHLFVGLHHEQFFLLYSGVVTY